MFIFFSVVVARYILHVEKSLDNKSIYFLFTRNLNLKKCACSFVCWFVCRA